MNVKEMTIQKLLENGFDGLYNELGGCDCILDDLMPCNNDYIAECEPGYMIKANRVYFQRGDSNNNKHYHVTGYVTVPGLGEIELHDCLSIETMERVCREVEAIAAIKLNIVKQEPIIEIKDNGN